jgi:hypothetical protein
MWLQVPFNLCASSERPGLPISESSNPPRVTAWVSSLDAPTKARWFAAFRLSFNSSLRQLKAGVSDEAIEIRWLASISMIGEAYTQACHTRRQRRGFESECREFQPGQVAEYEGRAFDGGEIGLVTIRPARPADE